MTSEIRVWVVLGKKTMSDPFQVKTTLEPHLLICSSGFSQLFISDKLGLWDPLSSLFYLFGLWNI